MKTEKYEFSEGSEALYDILQKTIDKINSNKR